MATTDVEVRLEDGPWDGMLDSPSPSAQSTGKYLLGQNIYPLDPEIAESVVGRPGSRPMGAGLAGRIQGIFQFEKITGQTITVAVAGGHFYQLDWGTETWTEAFSLGAMAIAGVALHPVNKVAFNNFHNQLHVSDGFNKPFLWDGTFGGGLTALPNSEAMYGQPRVYFARIIGIVAADRSTIIWSETDNALIGYRSGGFNNAWSPTQNDPDQLVSLLSTNSVTYALRARSALPLEGQPGPDFSTDNTHDSVSDTLGTLSPFASILHDVNLLVLDANAHPQLLRPGGAGFIPLWREFRQTTRNFSKDPIQLEKCMTVFYEPASLYLIAVPDAGAVECNMCLVLDGKGDLPKPVAVWRFGNMTSLAMVENLNGQPFLMHGDTTGQIYIHGNPDDPTLWDDHTAAGVAVAIEHILEQQPQGYSTKIEKIFDRVDFAIRGVGLMTLNVLLTTPYGASAEQQIVVGQNYPGWDQILWDVGVWDQGAGQTTQEVHADVGVDGEGRWAKVRVRHQALGEQFALEAITITGYTMDDDPEVP